LRLYHHPLSPYSRKTVSAILFRRDPVQLQLLDVMAGALATPEFRAISPFGKMPVLVTDEGPLIESTSIVELLEERGPRVLLPDEHAREARHWDRLGDLYLIDPMSVAWFKPDTPEAEVALVTAHHAWELLDRRLEGRAFVCGTTFTLGDLGPSIATDYLIRLGETPSPRIVEWCARCFDHPAMAGPLLDAMPMIEASLARRAGRR
jgi:glutathione S-transferase